MATQVPASAETRFNWGSWLTLFVASALLVSTIAFLAFRLTLPTDGWDVNENDQPGLAYWKDRLGNPSALEPGDQVTAIEGVPADWQTGLLSSMLRESWRAGATLEYTVIRNGQELQIPVTLVHWQVGKWLRSLLSDPVKVASQLSGIMLLALAAFTFFHRPGNPAANAFLLIMVILVSIRLSETLPSGFAAQIDPVASFVTGRVNWFILLALFPFALIQFALVFPHPKPIQQRHPWLAYAAGSIGLLLNVFAPDNPIGWFWFVFSLFLAVAILIHNAFTMRDTVSRAQMRWGLGGLLIGFGTLALLFLAGTTLDLYRKVSPDLLDLVLAFAMTAMGVMLAVAILRYRLFDIDIIIRRTLVYTTLMALLALVYFGSVVILQTLVGRAAAEQSPLVIVLSTLLIAVLFSPLRSRVHALIDRRFFRQKYDAEQVLAKFAQTARNDVALEALTAELTRVVQETVQPERVLVWVKPLSLPS